MTYWVNFIKNHEYYVEAHNEEEALDRAYARFQMDYPGVDYDDTEVEEAE